MIFYKDAIWNWEQGKIEKELVITVVSQEKFPHDDDGGGCGGGKKRGTTTISIKIKFIFIKLSSKKDKKNLSDMYARCKICIMKPENFEETIKNKN